MLTRRKLDHADYRRCRFPVWSWSYDLDGVTESIQAPLSAYIKNIAGAIGLGMGPLFYGGPGVGKTGAAVVVGKEFRSVGLSVYFTGIPDLRDSIKEKTFFQEDQSVMQRCRTVQVLILDRLELIQNTDHYLSIRTITELIAQRREDRLITIGTTRLPIHEWDNNFKIEVKPCMVPVSVEGEDRGDTRVQEGVNLFGEP